MPVALFITLLIVISGGTSLAAERALPGDLLYPVKISVNENIRSAISLSNESKVDWEIDKVERRLEEIEKLKIKDQFTAASSLEAKMKVDAQIASAARSANKFEESEKSAAANSRLEAILKGHAQVLLILSEDNNGTSEIILDILEDTKAVSESRIEAEDKIYVDNKTKFEATAKNKMKAVENKIAEVKKTINRFSFSLSESTKVRADAQLNSALMVYGEGKIKADEKLYNEAVIKFQEALRLAQEAQIIVNSANKLKIDWQIQLDQSEVEDSEIQEADKESAGEEQTEDKSPLQLDLLIDAANKINTRNRIEINPGSRSGNSSSDQVNQAESEGKTKPLVDVDGEIDSSSVNFNGSLNF